MVEHRPNWQWNEFQHVGTDYADVTEVERYEQRMGEFRDLAAEDAGLLADLALPAGAPILELGTGTGHFARAAARAGHPVTAADISPVMLDYARRQTAAAGLTGIDWVHGGFLTFECPPGSFAAAVSVAVLHHLPDAWKAVAVRNVQRALQPGGVFLLRDVVFDWDGDDHAVCFEGFINAFPPSTQFEAARHAAQEYSTLGWIMRGLLERAGFVVEREARLGALSEYLCRRP